MPCGLDITAFVGDDGTADLGDLDVGFPLGANVYRWRRVSLLGMLYKVTNIGRLGRLGRLSPTLAAIA